MSQFVSQDGHDLVRVGLREVGVNQPRSNERDYNNQGPTVLIDHVASAATLRVEGARRQICKIGAGETEQQHRPTTAGGDSLSKYSVVTTPST